MTRRLRHRAADDRRRATGRRCRFDRPPQGFRAATASGKLFVYGYGAYGYAIPPSFSTSRLSLVDRGFAYAIAHIRGGDDLGYQWFLDGKLKSAHNTFNDFVDVDQRPDRGRLCQAPAGSRRRADRPAAN